MAPWLKAGLIGTAVMIILALGTAIPALGLACCLAWPVAYAATGALAAYFMPPRREASRAAGLGAIAAVMAALAGGLVATLVAVVTTATTNSADILSMLPADLVQQFEAAGGDLATLENLAGPTGALLGGGMCCGLGIVLAAILGAVGGAVVAAVRPD